jgi:hypothetical protein
VEENKRLSSNLRSGAALVNESLGIIADALRPGDRDREADPLTPIPPPAAATTSTAPTPPAVASGGTLSQPPSGNSQNGQASLAAQAVAAPAGAAGGAMAMAAASAAANGAANSSGFQLPAGWPEEEPPGFRGGLLRDMDSG